MNPIRIPVTMSPHIVDGNPRGYYLLAQRLFPNGAPILRKDQFVGFNGSLIVTVARHNTWDTLMDMNVYARDIGKNTAAWFGKTKLYPMNKGFRMYIPGTILKPPSAEAVCKQTTGIFSQFRFYGGVDDLYYLEIPSIGGDVLLGRKEL